LPRLFRRFFDRSPSCLQSFPVPALYRLPSLAVARWRVFVSVAVAAGAVACSGLASPATPSGAFFLVQCRFSHAAPDDPNVSDTLGWIFYNRGVYQRAVGLLRESASKLPDKPIVQYHLGLAPLKVGDKEGARKALTAAVNSPEGFAGKDDARKALAEFQ
jgi:tetratricopeptide (TPR) repeat protein